MVKISFKAQCPALTLPKVKHVIDSGLSKVLVLDTDRHCQGLVEKYISQVYKLEKLLKFGMTISEFGEAAEGQGWPDTVWKVLQDDPYC